MKISEQVGVDAQAIAPAISIASFDGPLISIRAADVVAVQDLPPLPKSNNFTGARARIFFGSHSIVVRGTELNINSALNSALTGAAINLPYIHLTDDKASGTDGGTFTQDAWQTRDLNTEVTDTDDICTLASNQITLPSGDYICFASAPAFRVTFNQLRLEDVDSSTTLVLGGIAHSGNLAGGPMGRAILQGRFTLSGSTTLELQHFCNLTRATNGFGGAGSITTERYAQIEFWKRG